ncbi:dephospho-CoA kinase [Pelobium manganitolerans]|uniref:dephospho-CoA kinase n=1 Tax=Pelobium manganitolerans TaxID=1842495 RepID=UPI003FA36CDB
MLKIGITGGIGSGKTTVCQIFSLLGVPVFYADIVAKDLMVTDAVLIAQVKRAFGNKAYFDNGSLNRKHVSDIVFNNKQELEKLNSYVHPAVFRAMDVWASQQKSSYVLKEAALLFESGSYRQNDFNILVSADEDLRIKRVMERDGVTHDKVEARMRNQLSEQERLNKADFVIDNNGTQLLIPQVLHLHQVFLDKASGGAQQ